MRIKVAHIHTNANFISNSDIFSSSKFENTNVFLCSNSDLKKNKNPNNCEVFSWEKNGLQKTATYLANFDIVVLHGLCQIKTKLVAILSDKPKLLWRLFGYELYDLKRAEYLSEKSITFKKYKLGIFPKGMIKTIFSLLNNKIESLFNKSVKIQDVFCKIDYILVFCEEEYKHLKTKWDQLPEFINFPMPPKKENIKSTINKKNQIVLGNSKSTYNNHFDYIEKLLKIKDLPSNLDFILFFNYPRENFYTYQLRKLLKDQIKFKIINNFLSLTEFEDIYSQSSAFVFNGYRQMAMGNINTALMSGVKVYLNKKNAIYDWAKNNNFYIYDINDLIIDIKENNYKLSAEQIRHNDKIYSNLCLKFSYDKFHIELLDKLKLSI